MQNRTTRGRQRLRNVARTAAVVALFGAAHGCGDDDGASPSEASDPSDNEGTGSTGAAPGEGSRESTTTAQPEAMTGSDGGAGSTGAEEQPAPRPAAGIHIDAVEGNQGVGFDIALDGAIVAPPDQGGQFVPARPLLIRALWSLDDEDGWEPRSIRAQLTILDGEESLSLDVVEYVDGPASTLEPGGNFGWLVEAEWIGPQTEYVIELFEFDAEAEGADAPERFPASGAAPLAVGNEPLTLELVLIPFDYEVGDCSVPADVDEASAAALRDALFDVLPVSDVQVTLQPRRVWTEELLTWGQLNVALRGLRERDGARPWEHYLGIIGEPCNGEPAGNFSVSQALSAPPQTEESPHRVGSTSYSFSRDPFYAAQAVTTILGLQMGRGLISCPAYPASEPEDFDAPAQGLLLAHGYSITDASTSAPETRWDLMSMCWPRWITRYGWNELYPVLEVLSEWRDEG